MTPTLGDDSVGGGEPEACALTDSFGRKEWVEDSRKNIGWNTEAVVLDLYFDVRAGE
jgi:hypothetical protein